MAITEEKNTDLPTDSGSCGVLKGQKPESVSFFIPNALDGQRLDYALKVLFPNAGLRLRRRFCESGCIRLAGKQGKPAARVQAGQLVEWIPNLEKKTFSEEKKREAVVLYRNAGLAALFKPAGMYSAAIAGRDTLSLEAFLPELLPPESSYLPHLLNRLDYATSGLVLAAYSEAGERLWRQTERTGRIVKTYFALIEGQPLYDFTVKRKLDTDHRVRTRVLRADDTDSSRHTHVTLLHKLSAADIFSLPPFSVCGQGVEKIEESPLGRVESSEISPDFPLTLVRCRIYRGARHQIRAHLAAAGHPLLGDALYGSVLSTKLNHFFLHHGHIALPGFDAFCPSPWAALLPEDLASLCGTPLS